MQTRVALPDRETRVTRMRQHVEAVARSIVTDHDGDAIFERYLSLTRHVRNYSVGNRMLMAWQAPESRLVASRSAFDAIARKQGHDGREFASRRGKVWTQHVTIAAGARAVWVWGPTQYRVRATVTDPDTGEEREELVARTGFVPVDVWAVEDIRYVDDGQPMSAPDFVQPVVDETLYRSLLAFAAARGITVSERGLHGARGVSLLGEIGLQVGDHWSLHVAPLIHEIAHELMHDLRARLEPGTRELHEHEAEAAAAVVLAYYGHSTSVSSAYLRGWGARPADVIRSMDRIAKGAGEIVDFVEMRAGDAVDAPGVAASTRRPVVVA